MNNYTDFFSGKKVLVTGGAGFVGTNLILRLCELGANVCATFYKRAPQIRFPQVKFYICDLRDESFAYMMSTGIDYVFMCAANTSGAGVIEKTPLAHVTPNVIMNALMLQAAYEAGVKKFLFISSNAVYPVADHPVREEEMEFGNLFPKYFFAGWMKQFSEVMCEMYGKRIKSPMPVIVVRPANLYGKFDDFEWETSHMPAANIRKVLEHHDPIEVWGDGNDVKDLLYVGDFVLGMILAMEKIENFEILNIASGIPVTTKEFLSTALQIEDYNPKIVFDVSKPSMIRKRLIDTKKAERLLGFKATTSLEDGLRKTMSWYKETKMRKTE